MAAQMTRREKTPKRFNKKFAVNAPHSNLPTPQPDTHPLRWWRRFHQSAVLCMSHPSKPCNAIDVTDPVYGGRSDCVTKICENGCWIE
jgi:hypothetical protein